MTITELITDFEDLLEAAFTAASQTVETVVYDVLDPPAAYRAKVCEGDEVESGENARDLNQLSGGSFVNRISLQVICEAPWDGKLATAQALDAVQKTVKATVHANRDIDAATGVDATVGRVDGVDSQWALYPGEDNSWVKQYVVRCSWRSGSTT